MKYLAKLKGRWMRSKEKADKDYYDMVEMYGFSKRDERVFEVAFWVLVFLIFRVIHLIIYALV